MQKRKLPHSTFNELYGNKSGTRPSHVMSCSKIESVAIDERNDKAITDSMCNSGSSQDISSSATSSLKKNQ